MRSSKRRSTCDCSSRCPPARSPARASVPPDRGIPYISQAIRDANQDMKDPTCNKAFSQVTNEDLVYVKILGLVKGQPTFRDCRLQRLRTQAGGRSVIHELRTVDAKGTSMNSAQELEKIKEANRYQIDDCRQSSATDDPSQLTGSGVTQTLGLLDVSDAVWAKLRVYDASADELNAVPASWDERKEFFCPNAQAIQDQGRSCGESTSPHAVRLSALV
jgi:hypothetical protein